MVTKKATQKKASKNTPKKAAPRKVAAQDRQKKLSASAAASGKQKKPVAAASAAGKQMTPPPKQKANIVSKQKEAAKPAKKAPETPAKAVSVPELPQPQPQLSAPAPTVAAVKGKLLPRAFLEDLALAIRAAVAPLAKESKGREIIGQATSGDATFEIDRSAEKALLTFLKNARVPVAYYSEDAGYTTFTNAQPQHLLIIDPIDGTRSAKSGFEGCTVSIASTRVIERPVMADVDNAVIAEILGDRVFYAERGKGVRITQDGHQKRPKLSKNTDLEQVSWSMTVPARPAELIFPTAARLIDISSLKGGFFACNSTSFSLTRLLTNQLDACVDVANRFLRDIPDVVQDQFVNAGRGTILGIAPYDLAAALLIAQEAGCVVTDAYGHSFETVMLLDTSVENQRSMLAASSKQLHQKLLKFFDLRVRQWEGLLQRRAERKRAATAQGGEEEDS